jgi:hypothetical protein
MTGESEEELKDVRDGLTRVWWRCDAVLTELKNKVAGLMTTKTENGTPVSSGDSSHCTDNSVSGRDSSHVNNVKIDISDRTLGVLAIIIAVLAIGMIIMLPAQQHARVEVLGEQAAKAEREARVMQERWNDLKVELAKRGIPVSDH